MDKEEKTESTKDEVNSSSEISISDLFKALNSSKKFIIYSTSIAILAMTILWAITPTKYRATALLAVASSDQSSSISSIGGLGGLAGLAGISIGQGSNNIKTSIAIYKSRMFIEDYINDEELLKKLFSEDWDNKNNRWKTEPPTVRSGFGIYRDMMEIMETNGMYRVTFTGPNPKIVEELTNNSVIRLNNYSREQAIEESKRSIQYLEQQLLQTKVKNSQDFLYNLIEDQTKNIMLATSREEYVFKFIDPAILPTSKYSPLLFQYLFLGFWLGSLFSSLLLVIIETSGKEIPQILKD
tara:strand:+ start:302 stop:1192 length:891 start_codon:yes stop_codon:yes gene_type:complete